MMLSVRTTRTSRDETGREVYEGRSNVTASQFVPPMSPMSLNQGVTSDVAKQRIRCGILIVNYNSAKHVQRAVQSVLRHTCMESVRVQIVDNASGAEDREQLGMLSGEQVYVDELHSNLGFARGNNAAVRLLESRHTPDYLLFMNPDVEILSAGTIEGLLAAIANSDPGIVGSQPLVWDPRKAETAADQIMIRRVPLYWDLVVAESLLLRPIFPRKFARFIMADVRPYCGLVPFEVPSGAFFAIDRTAFHEVGGWDDRTFLYGEELFLGAKLKSRGWRFVLDAQLCVAHLQGSSAGFSRRFPRRSMFNHHRRSTCLFARSQLGCSRVASAFLQVVMEIGFVCRVLDFALAPMNISFLRTRGMHTGN